jgi:hypothetical protein
LGRDRRVTPADAPSQHIHQTLIRRWLLLPALSDEELPGSDQSTPMLNLAWHIKSEIEAYLRKIGFRGRIIDIISQDDFSANS